MHTDQQIEQASTVATASAICATWEAFEQVLCEIRLDNRVRIQLESKDEMKKRGLDSPDDADALALTFAVPVAAPEPNRDYEEPWIPKGPLGWLSVWCEHGQKTDNVLQNAAKAPVHPGEDAVLNALSQIRAKGPALPA